MIDLPMATSPTDPLAQATRAKLFALLGELKRPAGTAELSERLDMHPNGVRVHLERLAQAGLVVRVQVRQIRGRPTDAWSISPHARPGGEPPRAYRDLARWLARALRGRSLSRRRIEAAGREIGREIAPAGPHDDPSAFATALATLGFQPSVTAEQHGRVTFTLANCPYREAARENETVICTLHKGITRGLVDVIHPGGALTSFVARDPDRAGCTVEVETASATYPAK